MKLRLVALGLVALPLSPAPAETLERERVRDIVVLRNLLLAGREYRDVRAAIDPGETASDLNIGTSILRDFIITTDFAGGAIWLEPRETRP